jgi:hypothetical protein
MSADTLILSPIFDTSLSLAEEEGTCEMELRANADLMLELTPVIGIGSSVGSPELFAFAAAHG